MTLENRPPHTPHFDSMEEGWSEMMSSKVQEMCDGLQQRAIETAVIILNRGCGQTLTFGSSVGKAFLQSRPDLATLFQEFYNMYDKGVEIIDTGMVSETMSGKERDCETSRPSENCDSCEDYPALTADLESEGESNGQESYNNMKEPSEGAVVESKRITRQSKKITTQFSGSNKITTPCSGSKKITNQCSGSKKITTQCSGSKKITNQCSGSKKITTQYSGMFKKNTKSLVKKKDQKKLGDSSQSVHKSVEMNSDVNKKQYELTSAFKCFECNKRFKSEAGLTAHNMYIHLKKRLRKEVCTAESGAENEQSLYIDKDGKEASGALSTLCEKHVTEESTSFTCKICSYSTEKYNVMTEHLQTHAVCVILACSLCNKTFQSKKSLWRHTNQHKKCPHLCKTCLRMYSSKDELKKHEVTHNSSHVCSICNRTYDSLGRLNYHMKTSHGPKQNSCDICGSSFTNKSLLNQHKTRHGPKHFFCDKCSSSFYFMHQLTNHLKVHDENSLKYKCSVCSKEYINKSHWKEHIKLHDGSNFVQCEQCGKSYNSKKSLNLHINTKHVEERRFICQVCGKAFMTKHHLKNHLISHDDKREYKCRFCNAAFKKNDVLKMHENVHTREQKFICDICGEHFLRRSSLRNHHLTHFPGHQRWKCRYCEQKFRTQSAMLTHIKNKHTELDLSHERPLCKRCEQCGKVFAKGLAFRIHMDMHAGIKRYKCQTCGSAFTDPANLRVHQKIHDGTSKKYICECCDSQFSSLKQYTVHMLKHNNKTETQPLEQYQGNNEQLPVKSVEERNKFYNALPTNKGFEEAEHDDSDKAVKRMNLSKEQLVSDQKPGSSCHNHTIMDHFKNNPSIHSTNSCLELLNTNTEHIVSTQAMVISGFCENASLSGNTSNHSGYSLRKEVDINNFTHIHHYQATNIDSNVI